MNENRTPPKLMVSYFFFNLLIYKETDFVNQVDKNFLGWSDTVKAEGIQLENRSFDIVLVIKRLFTEIST